MQRKRPQMTYAADAAATLQQQLISNRGSLSLSLSRAVVPPPSLPNARTRRTGIIHESEVSFVDAAKDLLGRIGVHSVHLS